MNEHEKQLKARIQTSMMIAGMGAFVFGYAIGFGTAFFLWGLR